MERTVLQKKKVILTALFKERPKDSDQLQLRENLSGQEKINVFQLQFANYVGLNFLTLWHSDCPRCGIHLQTTRSACELHDDLSII